MGANLGIKILTRSIFEKIRIESKRQKDKQIHC